MTSSTVQYRCVYGLIDPRNGEVFYVGQTNCPQTRLDEHIISSSNVWLYISQEEYYLVTDKEYRIAEIKREYGKYPEMRIILDGQYTYGEICKLETQTIKKYLGRGVLLTNTNSIMREKERISQEARCEEFLADWHKKYSSMEDWRKQHAT